MKKIVLAGLVSALIVGAGFMIQSVAAEDSSEGWFKGGGLYNSIEEKAEKMGMSVEEFKEQIQEKKGQMKDNRLEKLAEMLNMSIEELKEQLENKTIVSSLKKQVFQQMSFLSLNKSRSQNIGRKKAFQKKK